MGQYVNRNGRTLYKADDGLLYPNYEAAVKARSRSSGGGGFNIFGALGSLANTAAQNVQRTVGQLAGGGQPSRPAPQRSPAPVGAGRTATPPRPAQPPRNSTPNRQGALDGLGLLGRGIQALGSVASNAPGLGIISPIIPAGAAYLAANVNKNARVVPAEAALDAVARTPMVAAPRAIANAIAQGPAGATPLPGNGSIATVVDSGENFLKAVTGFRGNVSPQSYAPDTRDRVANAIDKAIIANRPTDDTNGFVPVDYDDYSPNGSRTDSTDRFVFGRFMGRRNPDGTYELRGNERYDYTGGTYEGNAEYMEKTRQSIKDAQSRGDYLAVFSNSQDVFSRNTGAGAEGFGIGGQFTRSTNQLPPRTNPAPSGPSGFSMPTPGAGGGPRTSTPPPSQGGGQYVVRSGDTLWDIAAKTGISIDELARRNNIANRNLINVGQQLRY
ncbi:LysM peptidoglycan-binding domain-containing protein [Synechococcus elongatus]|uniref:LysM peptidoglycan-binding domain-containing protein n=1 Tax=Synechococcus elongatus TaxID=32046 RepID=UPI00192D68D9|nr:LysM domain-containing protein [Synechococcus elongatus]